MHPIGPGWFILFHRDQRPEGGIKPKRQPLADDEEAFELILKLFVEELD